MQFLGYFCVCFLFVIVSSNASISAVDFMESLLLEMICSVSSGTLNSDIGSELTDDDCYPILAPSGTVLQAAKNF